MLTAIAFALAGRPGVVASVKRAARPVRVAREQARLSPRSVTDGLAEQQDDAAAGNVVAADDQHLIGG
ncbi:MAG TPA: hypothetical protein VKI99_15490, partial [Candidatus Dormibacteraeota bacterium]|nr:hypothetical protein [Candidatus Dormibacteraeota bacterium]